MKARVFDLIDFLTYLLLHFSFCALALPKLIFFLKESSPFDSSKNLRVGLNVGVGLGGDTYFCGVGV